MKTTTRHAGQPLSRIAEGERIQSWMNFLGNGNGNGSRSHRGGGAVKGTRARRSWQYVHMYSVLVLDSYLKVHSLLNASS